MKKQSIIAVVGAGIIGLTGISGAVVSADSMHGRQHTTKTTQSDEHIRVTAKLNQAVRDGVISDSQKTAFETELKTLRSEHKTAIGKSSTRAERKAERSKLQSELQSWAKANNFPLVKIFPKLAV